MSEEPRVCSAVIKKKKRASYLLCQRARRNHRMELMFAVNPRAGAEAASLYLFFKMSGTLRAESWSEITQRGKIQTEPPPPFHFRLSV